MKKNLLGLCIAAIAVTLFAFTDLQKSNIGADKAGVKPTTTSFYWYHVSGTQTVGTRINASPVDKATAMSTLTDCEDTSTDFCLYGSTNGSLPDNYSIVNPTEDQIIKETE